MTQNNRTHEPYVPTIKPLIYIIILHSHERITLYFETSHCGVSKYRVCVFVRLRICVFVRLRICVFVQLCVCVVAVVCLCSCVSVYLRNCVFVRLCVCVIAELSYSGVSKRYCVYGSKSANCRDVRLVRPPVCVDSDEP